MYRIRVFALLAISTGMAGCSINRSVTPILPTQVTQVCVLENKDVFMDGFQPEVQRQIEAKHIPTRSYSGARPAECSHYLEYTATWRYEMASVYLSYAGFRVYDARGLVGTALYDTRRGGMRLDKLGRTANKIRPLIDELFGSVTVGPGPVPVQTESTVTTSTSNGSVHPK